MAQFSGGGGSDRDPTRKYHHIANRRYSRPGVDGQGDGNRIERVVARAANLIVGRSAYEAACRVYPKARLTLRQGIRVIDETEG